MARKQAIKQVMTPTKPSGHKAVGVTPPFAGGAKPSSKAPAQVAPVRMNSNKGGKKGGMC